ncbi:hypothetical protein FGG08_001613 [Glutinoglossum americanum]|uniref:DNA mismatch repair proteins mutS family domain-containing protein n=1 Tax=Glutinoglossum americanum TaxID=1670608 RepID=A0A9P8IGJ7_9PEZI|nr:hypothetical protein FGG08_001613 [Glutinoglossum americanum]
MGRGAKRRSRARLADLPQGSIALEPLPRDEDKPAYPTVVQQARSNMTKFENCVLLTRLYFEHAEEFGPLLNLKVARKKTNAGPVAMAGFPFYQLDRFLKILVQDLNRYVAISEEFPNDASAKVKSGGLMFDRKVTRIITPGTLIDENFMDPYENNFLLGIHMETKILDGTKGNGGQTFGADEATTVPVGLAWLDLSTGDFFTQSTTLMSLPSAIARIRPREIVLDKSLQALCDHDILLMLQEDRYLVTYHQASPEILPVSAWSPMLEVPVSEKLRAEFTTEEVSAGSSLLGYVRVRLLGMEMKLQPPIRRLAVENMGIDKNSMRALEIKSTLRDGVSKGSLFHAIRRTVTKSGARMLGNWLTSPSTSLSTINNRLNLVSQFLDDQDLRANMVQLLRRCYDSQRLVQKFSLGRGDPEDLIALLRTIEATQGISTILGDMLGRGGATPIIDRHLERSLPGAHSATACIAELLRRLSIDGPTALANQISKAIDEEGLMQKQRIEESKAASVMEAAQGIVDAEAIEEEGIATLKNGTLKGELKSNGGGGEGGGGTEFEDVWVMRKRASTILRNLHAALDVLGAERIDQTKLQIKAEEERIFQSLRQQVIYNLAKLRRNAVVLDELDVLCSFATLAQEQHFVRPILGLRSSHKIVGGRHPMVEAGLYEQGRSFTPNDCFIGEEERVWFITGPAIDRDSRPNMAGKSTFLRQNALITILAQVGSYVPAEYAEIGIVDQIFSRVGSADDLSHDRSTFMVEMLEAAEILNQATPRSFVIMDEIGRGTTPEDGIAVGYACLDHLYRTNKSRLLFATHFHTLADMAKHFKHIGFYCTDVAEDAHGSFSYVHRLRAGVNRQSHALKVARLAGLPESAIRVARDVLDTLRPQITSYQSPAEAGGFGQPPVSIPS